MTRTHSADVNELRWTMAPYVTDIDLTLSTWVRDPINKVLWGNNLPVPCDRWWPQTSTINGVSGTRTGNYYYIQPSQVRSEGERRKRRSLFNPILR